MNDRGGEEEERNDGEREDGALGRCGASTSTSTFA